MNEKKKNKKKKKHSFEGDAIYLGGAQAPPWLTALQRERPREHGRRLVGSDLVFFSL